LISDNFFILDRRLGFRSERGMIRAEAQRAQRKTKGESGRGVPPLLLHRPCPSPVGNGGRGVPTLEFLLSAFPISAFALVAPRRPFALGPWFRLRFFAFRFPLLFFVFHPAPNPARSL
jgi:hypothetical protein